jgi:hypothetical protein
MGKLWKNRVLLFAIASAVFALAPMASAASWSPIGTSQTLISSNLAVTQSLGGGLMLGASCASSTFGTVVTSAAVLTINGATFATCSGTGIANGCTVTATGTGFPWKATAVSTTNIQIHGIRVDVRFATAPGGATPCTAGVHNTSLVWTGTLTGGSWDPSGTLADRTLTFSNAPGTVFHGTSTQPAFVNGIIRNGCCAALDVLM